MKKYIILLLLCLCVLPVNAQRVIKYVSFYPVPYASHTPDKDEQDKVYVLSPENYESLNLISSDRAENMRGDGKAILNFNSGSTIDVISTFTLLGEQFETQNLNIQTIYSADGSIGNNTTNIRSGNSVLAETYFGNFNVPDGSVWIKGAANTEHPDLYTVDSNVARSVKVNGSNILKKVIESTNFCNGYGSWQPLRLAGTEECKYYLVCSHGNNPVVGGNDDCAMNRAEKCRIRQECNPDWGQDCCFNKNDVCEKGGPKTKSCTDTYSNTVDRAGYSLKRTRTCKDYDGWKYGNWTGSCCCDKGYYWSDLTNGCKTYNKTMSSKKNLWKCIKLGSDGSGYQELEEEMRKCEEYITEQENILKVNGTYYDGGRGCKESCRNGYMGDINTIYDYGDCNDLRYKDLPDGSRTVCLSYRFLTYTCRKY